MAMAALPSSPQVAHRVVQAPIEVPVSVAQPTAQPALQSRSIEAPVMQASPAPMYEQQTTVPQTVSVAPQYTQYAMPPGAAQPIVMPPIVQPMMNMCKVTVASLEEHTGNYTADWMVKIKYAGMEAPTTVRRSAGPGQETSWNESIEFMVNAGNEVGFDVEDEANPQGRHLGSAVTPLVPGAFELPVTAVNGTVQGKLRVAIGLAYPSTGGTITAPPGGMPSTMALPPMTSMQAPHAAPVFQTSSMAMAPAPYPAASYSGYSMAPQQGMPTMSGMYPSTVMTAAPQTIAAVPGPGISD